MSTIFLKDGEKEEIRLIHPVKYPDIYALYSKQKSCYWVPDEIKFEIKDLTQFQELTEGEQNFIKMILAFFARSDVIVNENLATNFITKAKCPELKSLFRYQAMMEDIHSDTYALLLDYYITDKKEKEKYLNAIETIPSIKKKAEWCYKYIEQGTIIQQLVAFAIVEGVLFSGSFGGIFYFKSKGKLNALTTSNELIFRDETMHYETNCHLYKNHVAPEDKLQESEVVKILQEAVDNEIEFMNEALPVDIIGLNAKLMTKHIQFTADTILFKLIGKHIYHVNESELPSFVRMIGFDSKSNFFEVTPTAYKKTNEGNKEMNFNEEF